MTKKMTNGNSGGPRGFGTGVHRMPAASPLRQVPLITREEQQQHAARRMAVRDRFKEAMAPGAPEPSASSDADQARKETLLRAGGRPMQPLHEMIRSDNFDTYEHKAAAELLQDILQGKDPLRAPVKSDTHVLLRRKDGKPPDLSQPVPLSALEVASSDPSWQAGYQHELREVINVYQPSRDLQVGDQITLHYGEIIALAGDYYDTPQQLHDELTDDVAGAIRGISPTSTGTGLLDYNRDVAEYLWLALKNLDHFCPYNWVRYCRHHCEALQMALTRDLDGALVRNAFADHFLTDAFATGHMRTPRMELAGIGGGEDAKEMHDEDNVHGLWVQDLAGHVWRAYGDDNLGTNPIHLLMTTITLGRSIQRVYRTFRMEGDDRKTLGDLLQQGLSKLPQRPQDVTRNPADLPAVLGPCGSLMLPDIMRALPVPLPSAPSPNPQALVNFPPLYVGTTQRPKSATPAFDKYFCYRQG